MNVVCILLCIYMVGLFWKKWITADGNISNNEGYLSGDKHTRVDVGNSTGTVTYDFIRGREQYVYRDRRLNSICPELCIRLRDLGINKKRTRRGKRPGNRNKMKDRPVRSKDFNNLVKIQLNSSTNI